CPFSLSHHPPPPPLSPLPLHDALPICCPRPSRHGSFTSHAGPPGRHRLCAPAVPGVRPIGRERSRPASALLGCPPLDRRRTMLSDRKSTRLNSSHVEISYAVFCLKKKK